MVLTETGKTWKNENGHIKVLMCPRLASVVMGVQCLGKVMVKLGSFCGKFEVVFLGAPPEPAQPPTPIWAPSLRTLKFILRDTKGYGVYISCILITIQIRWVQQQAIHNRNNSEHTWLTHSSTPLTPLTTPPPTPGLTPLLCCPG